MQDELRPISCTGHNNQGGMALTLIDALDSLLVRPGATYHVLAINKQQAEDAAS